LIREAAVDDAQALIDFAHSVSGESDFLSFGPGEFDLTVTQQEEYLQNCLDSDNKLYLVALIDRIIVGRLNFIGGRRPRMRHSGGFGMVIQKQVWGLGIGGLMLDTLIQWAGESGIVTKINLQVRTDNHRAMALYQRKGFITEGTLRKEIFLNGQYFDLYWMGLEL
jgi:RimJ/RimL family protein N-acetyltransferase